MIPVGPVWKVPIATMAPLSEVLLTKGCRFQSLTVVESGALAICTKIGIVNLGSKNWLRFTRSVLQAPEMAEKKEPAKEVEKPKADGVKACL